jgi:hypothetical protein
VLRGWDRQNGEGENWLQLMKRGADFSCRPSDGGLRTIPSIYGTPSHVCLPPVSLECRRNGLERINKTQISSDMLASVLRCSK